MPRPPRAKQPDSNPLGDPSATSSPSLRDPDARLPVNPRRTKVAPEQRKRVAKACNRCNQKRIKCSGDQPCRQCIGGGLECRYPPPAQKITITKQDLDHYHAQVDRLRALERLLEEKGIPLPVHEPAQTTPPPDGGDGLYDDGGMPNLGLSPSDMVDVMDGNTEFSDIQQDQGKLLTDTDGTERYLGETSGAMYLERCKEFITPIYPILRRSGNSNISRSSSFLASRGRYQTSDSQLMNLPTVDPLWLPPQDDRQKMLAEISTYFQDGNGRFGSGGIFFWPWKDVATINPNRSSPPVSKKSNRHLALYHVAFALASLLKGQPSEAHFSRAWYLVGNPLDIPLVTFDDVAALGLMALYLFEINRRDAAWMYIRNAVDLSIMLGAHRSNDNSTFPAEEKERRRRTFWTVYILDRWLSILVGRPSSVSREAFTLPLPEEMPGLPSPAGLRANIHLAHISDKIVWHNYHPHTPAQEIRFANDILSDLKTWKEDLPDPITLVLSKTLEPAPRPRPALALILGEQARDYAPPEPKLPSRKDLEAPVDLTQVIGRERGLDRAYLSMRMSYNQLFILAIRPAFLAAVKKLVAERYFRHKELLMQPVAEGYLNRKDLSIDRHVLCQEFRESGDVARDTLIIGAHIKTHLEAPGNKLLVADLHHIFNAAVHLLMFRISFVNLRGGDTRHIKFAKEVFAEEAKAGSASARAYGEDCLAVLEDIDGMVDDLRKIVHKLDDNPDLWTPLIHEQSEPDFEEWRDDEEVEGTVWEPFNDALNKVQELLNQDSEGDVDMDSPEA
ncbi:Fungal specific transcription factor domain containing protein [Naviculisporaceae sp. PSN 640]